MTEEQKQGSEFGRGLVICLVKFAEHKERLYANMEVYRKVHLTDNRAASMHMHGAGDHLFEIQVPAAMQGTPLGDSILALQAEGLRMRSVMTDDVTVADVESFNERIRQVALEIDRYLGLNPDMGEW